MPSREYSVAAPNSTSAVPSAQPSPPRPHAVPEPSPTSGTLTHSASEPLAPAERVSLQLSSAPDDTTSKASLATPASQAPNTKLSSPTQPGPPLDGPEDSANAAEAPAPKLSASALIPAPQHDTMPTLDSDLSAAALIPASQAEEGAPAAKADKVPEPELDSPVESQPQPEPDSRPSIDDAAAEKEAEGSPESSSQQEAPPAEKADTGDLHMVSVKVPIPFHFFPFSFQMQPVCCLIKDCAHRGPAWQCSCGYVYFEAGVCHFLVCMESFAWMLRLPGTCCDPHNLSPCMAMIGKGNQSGAPSSAAVHILSLTVI